MKDLAVIVGLVTLLTINVNVNVNINIDTDIYIGDNR